MAEALVIRNISKRFGGLRAVQDLDFSVGEGETVRIDPGRTKRRQDDELQPDHRLPPPRFRLGPGVRPRGSSACAHTTSAPMGWRAHFRVARPFGEMTVLANVMTGAFLRSRKPEIARERARETIDFVGLSAKEHTAARDLTAIDQRRLEMARALATNPRLLLLDEVMAGLNPAEIDQAVALIGKLSKSGLTIVIRRARDACHHGGVARHIVVLDHGQKIAEGTPETSSRTRTSSAPTSAPVMRTCRHLENGAC